MPDTGDNRRRFGISDFERPPNLVNEAMPIVQYQSALHMLRASFATHLPEKGVDIKYIKDLLGHFDIKTTERYLHVAREKLVVIQSPLDYLDPSI